MLFKKLCENCIDRKEKVERCLDKWKIKINIKDDFKEEWFREFVSCPHCFDKLNWKENSPPDECPYITEQVLMTGSAKDVLGQMWGVNFT